jgi:hypothetical protein
MTNDAATAATTTHGQTGPRTEAGKAKSSRNSIRTGLYAARDFIRPDEEEEYAQTLIKLMDELTPDGTVEQTFATEIMGATWRLRRCRLVEEAFGLIEDLNFDPMMDERTEKQQKSVDRARAQSHLILRRSLAELCKLQSLRVTRDAIMAERKRTSFCNPVRQVPDPPSTEPPTPKTATSFCNPNGTLSALSNKIPRNAPCPCKSGAKYKKCCGGPAAPELNKAA